MEKKITNLTELCMWHSNVWCIVWNLSALSKLIVWLNHFWIGSLEVWAFLDKWNSLFAFSHKLHIKKKHIFLVFLVTFAVKMKCYVQELDATFLLPVHGATVCWLYWCVLHIKSSKITSCNGWQASFWLLNPQVSVANNFFISKMIAFTIISLILFFNKNNFWWETHLEVLQIEQRKAFKNSLNFSPNLQKFFSEKVSAGPIGFLAKYENVKGISKIHLSRFRHFAAFFVS